MRYLFLAAWALLALLPSAAPADILLYPLPGSDVVLALQGRVATHPGGTVTFRHPRFGSLYFRLADIRYYQVPTTLTIAGQKLQQAVQAGDADACIEAGRWALHHGLLPEFYKAASAAWKLAPNHPTVQRLAALKRKMDAPLPTSIEQEQEIRKVVATGRPMSFFRSKHFVLMHDTPIPTRGRGKGSRASNRLELLETVYESFLLKYCLEGCELDVPKEQLKVVLFGNKQDFLNCSEDIKPILSKVEGFYDKKDNVSVFYDQATDEGYMALERIGLELKDIRDTAVRERSPGAADLRRLVDTLQMLTEVSRENTDIEVTSHEITHQLAANTGLTPNEAPVPVWAAEGVATYFECPKDAAWSGIGTVNKQRLNWYRGLAGDREHSSIDFTVSDRVFMDAVTDEAIMHAYGQAWALTHFLMERHFDRLVKYYRSLALIQSEKRLTAEQNIQAFDNVFGDIKAQLSVEWRNYMRSLKTDVERVLEENE
jgi:hypothetical protein